jgi:hypothetical protein
MRPAPFISRRPRSAPALTLLEVLLAVLLLSLTICIVMGAVSSLAGAEGRGKMRLAAYEVANRIMLQFLDDEKALPPKNEAIEYGPYRFMWRLDKTTATMTINRKQESAGANLQKLDRYQLVCITVFEAEQNGNFEIKGEPLAYLTRVIDPFAPRNPDSIETFTGDMDKINGLIQNILGGSADTGSGGSAPLQGRQLK